MRETAIRIGKRLLAEVQRDDVAGMSAELAYRFLFAVFPFGIFVAALTAFVAQWAGIDDPTQKIVSGLSDNLPPDIANAIAPQIAGGDRHDPAGTPDIRCDRGAVGRDRRDERPDEGDEQGVRGRGGPGVRRRRPRWRSG